MSLPWPSARITPFVIQGKHPGCPAGEGMVGASRFSGVHGPNGSLPFVLGYERFRRLLCLRREGHQAGIGSGSLSPVPPEGSDFQAVAALGIEDEEDGGSLLA